MVRFGAKKVESFHLFYFKKIVAKGPFLILTDDPYSAASKRLPTSDQFMTLKKASI
jgi:hypothetical protein